MTFKIFSFVLLSGLFLSACQATTPVVEDTQDTTQKDEQALESTEEASIKPEDRWLSFEDLSFYLPAGWSEAQAMQGSEGVKFAMISVPDPEHKVQLKMIVTEGTAYDEGQEPIAQQGEAKVYQVACGGAYACYALVFMDVYEREIAFEVESDQAVPEDLDAPWMPSTTVTRDELVQFLLSAGLTSG